ncbi:phenylalanine--tRNA ligase subunit beta [Gemelliphila palaticanis]|uniref:Phenylalanine--tRNA ligase beta subunit n=1 Tax=Gemelliphila palaticanis TaxID=81950 RepID=A0ABX2T1B9_9BACL|nr:phenylalanine--tRNA ligase subunit beta [Gemella palaticanis]MBF0714881.1 phenylalanine--tRNA ligase subunit beta [Gemella palaticanis]NYS46811.1 phenylalanine--tRNA ligase subunit beta [Gemella palaticanis]
MLVSYNWLKEYVDLEVNAEKLADKITRSGLEVEEVIKLDKELTNIVVGYVKEKEKHPDAEKLNVCKVDVGTEELQIVCGASNVDKGQYVIVAKVGATLPGIKIKKAKLRGIESQGMICSLKELGLSNSVLPKNSQEGIYVFSEAQQLGANAIDILGLNDTIIDISITPNRADALSMRGMAYEASALYNTKSKLKEKFEDKKYDKTDLTVSVSSEDCLTYYGQVVKNIEVKESPLWIQSKLIKAGIRPINNIVDITNYVLLEYGQPMHAFDKDLLGNKIEVRKAKESEVLTTLDGEERKLKETDLVITDGEKPVALAGVMGGKDTEVSETTVNIVLESAYFNPVSVRKTSSYHGLRSDSSSRFEKGIDPKLQSIALERAVELIIQFNPQAEVEQSQSVVTEFENKQVDVTVDYLNNILGTNLSEEEIVKILSSLGFEISKEEDLLKIIVPSRRPDISIKQDIAEEVIRIYGYDNLESTLPKFSKSTKGGLTYKQKLLRDIRKTYLNNGFSDTINYSLVSDKESEQFTLESHNKVRLLMPMSETHSTLRQSLIPGLLTSLSYNKARQQKNLKLLEVGRVFFGSEEKDIQPEEVTYFSGALSGKEHITKWLNEEREIDFYAVKGYLEIAFEKLGILDSITYSATKIDNMHPGRTAKVYYNNEVIGFLGEIHPTYARELDIDTTYVFEINLDKILTNDKVKPRYEEISKYPKVTRDIAILINKEDEYLNIYSTVKSLNNRLIDSVELFDVYSGIGLPEDKKSLAISITYSDKEKTLTEEEINNAHNKVLDALVNYGATIR